MEQRMRRTERFKENYREDDLKKAKQQQNKADNKAAAQAFIAGMITFIALSAAAFGPK